MQLNIKFVALFYSFYISIRINIYLDILYCSYIRLNYWFHPNVHICRYPIRNIYFDKNCFWQFYLDAYKCRWNVLICHSTVRWTCYMNMNIDDVVIGTMFFVAFFDFVQKGNPKFKPLLHLISLFIADFTFCFSLALLLVVFSVFGNIIK